MHSAANYLLLMSLNTPGSDEYEHKKLEIHAKVAKRILWLSKTNKGIYLKFGQHIGNLEKVLPK